MSIATYSYVLVIVDDLQELSQQSSQQAADVCAIWHVQWYALFL